MKSTVLTLLSLLLVPPLIVLGVSMAQEPNPTPAPADAKPAKPLKIVPIVALKPGETKKLLLSTHCTVGATRAGGFSLAEMRNGEPLEGQTEGYEGASYTRDGVLIRIPDWDAAEKFANSPPYESLRKAGIAVFEVTVSVSNNSTPALLEMHLVDATCSGYCTTDFRVLVMAP